MSEYTRLWQFNSTSKPHVEFLVVSETDQPNLVAIETTGRVLLTREQWYALGRLASSYSTDGVRFAAESEQAALPLEHKA